MKGISQQQSANSSTRYNSGMVLGLPREAAVFLSLAASCSIISGLLTYLEVGEVNRRLSEDEQISYLFIRYPGQMAKIKTQYKRFYPTGRLDSWRFAMEIAALVFFGATAISAGFLK